MVEITKIFFLMEYTETNINSHILIYLKMDAIFVELVAVIKAEW